MDEGKKKDHGDFYKAMAMMSSLSLRIAMTGILIAGSIYYLVTACTPQKKSEVERTVEQSQDSTYSSFSHSQYITLEKLI